MLQLFHKGEAVREGFPCYPNLGHCVQALAVSLPHCLRSSGLCQRGIQQHESNIGLFFKNIIPVNSPLLKSSPNAVVFLPFLCPVHQFRHSVYCPGPQEFNFLTMDFPRLKMTDLISCTLNQRRFIIGNLCYTNIDSENQFNMLIAYQLSNNTSVEWLVQVANLTHSRVGSSSKRVPMRGFLYKVGLCHICGRFFYYVN